MKSPCWYCDYMVAYRMVPPDTHTYVKDGKVITEEFKCTCEHEVKNVF